MKAEVSRKETNAEEFQLLRAFFGHFMNVFVAIHSVQRQNNKLSRAMFEKKILKYLSELSQNAKASFSSFDHVSYRKTLRFIFKATERIVCSVLRLFWAFFGNCRVFVLESPGIQQFDC